MCSRGDPPPWRSCSGRGCGARLASLSVILLADKTGNPMWDSPGRSSSDILGFVAFYLVPRTASTARRAMPEGIEDKFTEIVVNRRSSQHPRLRRPADARRVHVQGDYPLDNDSRYLDNRSLSGRRRSRNREKELTHRRLGYHLLPPNLRDLKGVRAVIPRRSTIWLSHIRDVPEDAEEILKEDVLADG